MGEYTLGNVERRFAEIIWEHEPIKSGELVAIAEKELGWKKSTTYTILRRLGERGIFQNKDGIVTSLISKDEFYSLQSQQFVQDTFGGSLPKFLAAFSTRQKLSDKEIEALKNLIADSKEK